MGMPPKTGAPWGRYRRLPKESENVNVISVQLLKERLIKTLAAGKNHLVPFFQMAARLGVSVEQARRVLTLHAGRHHRNPPAN